MLSDLDCFQNYTYVHKLCLKVFIRELSEEVMAGLAANRPHSIPVLTRHLRFAGCERPCGDRFDGQGCGQNLQSF